MNIDINSIPCLAPFSSLNARFDTYSICCSSSYIVNGKLAKDKDIFNNYIYRKLRKAMLTEKGIPYECMHCIKNGMQNQNFEFDKIAIEEIAKKNIANMDNSYSIHDFKVGYLYVSMDRTCNLSCRMCNAISSSSYERNLSRIAKEEFGISNRIPKNHDVILDIISQYDLSYLLKMEFQGGELFLSKNFMKIVSLLPNVKLDIITNGTIYNKKMLEQLKRFNCLTLKVSIDGNREISEYIRCGSDYETIVNNVKRFSDYLDNAKIEISLTISKYNVSYLIETFKAFAKLTDYISDIKYHFLIDNIALSIYSISIEKREEIINKLKNTSIVENVLKPKMEEIVKNVVNELEQCSAYDDESVNIDSSSFDRKVDQVFHLDGL